MIEYVSQAAEVDELIDAGAPVLVCVSGGKDSELAARAAHAHCRARGHRGEFKLVYADVNSPAFTVTWFGARARCQALAEELGCELVVVLRAGGGLMERWWQRQRGNKARYCALQIVKTLLPWSTPDMRFCTSELKTGPIQRWIRNTYRDRPVVCVLGIRRDEGNTTLADGRVIKRDSGRSKAPVVKVYEMKAGKKPALPLGSVDWNVVVEVKTPEVYQIHIRGGHKIAEAYTEFGADRFSCCACIMGSLASLKAACRDPRNHAVIVEQCRLEVESTFSFQGDRWLCDVALEEGVLPDEWRPLIAEAKRKAALREEVESHVPEGLLFENNGGKQGWPERMPNYYEACVIAWVRRRVGEIMGWDVKYTEPWEVMERYAELIRERELRDERRESKNARLRAAGKYVPEPKAKKKKKNEPKGRRARREAAGQCSMF